MFATTHVWGASQRPPRPTPKPRPVRTFRDPADTAAHPRPARAGALARTLARALASASVRALRPVLAVAPILSLVLPLAGCGAFTWLGGGQEDPTAPTEIERRFEGEVTPRVLWSERPTRGSEGRRLRLVPAVGSGRVYVADARGRVAAVDADTGRTLWDRETKLAFSAGPDLGRDTLILGTKNGQVVALAASDGAEKWRAQLASEILSVPRLSGEGKVVVHTLDDSVIALDAAGGQELWRLGWPAPVLTLRGSSTPAIVPDGVIVGLSGGRLVKLAPADGAPLWEVVVTPPSGRSELSRIADIDADPVVVGNLVFVGTYNGDLAAVDSESGAVLWRRQLSSHAGLAADENALYVTDSEDRIWGADPAGGAGRWRQEELRFRQLTAPTPIGNLVAVGDLEGWLHLVAQQDGRLVGRTRIARRAPITARPVAAGGRLFVLASDGTLAALTVPDAPRGTGGPVGIGPGPGRDADAGPQTGADPGGPREDGLPPGAPDDRGPLRPARANRSGTDDPR